MSPVHVLFRATILSPPSVSQKCGWVQFGKQSCRLHMQDDRSRLNSWSCMTELFVSSPAESTGTRGPLSGSVQFRAHYTDATELRTSWSKLCSSIRDKDRLWLSRCSLCLCSRHSSTSRDSTCTEGRQRHEPVPPVRWVWFHISLNKFCSSVVLTANTNMLRNSGNSL